MEYLKIWTDFREVIEPLDDSEKGRLFEAMLDYAADGEEPSLAGNERYIWAYARQTIDRTRKESERLSINGSKGGRPPKKLEEPTETKQNQPEPEIPAQTKQTVKRFIPPTVEDVRAYCKDRGNKVDAERFVDFYTSKGWKVGDQSMKDWKAAVRTWEKRDAQGGNNQYPTKTVIAQQYSQRDYSGTEESMDEVMIRLMKQHPELDNDD